MDDSNHYPRSDDSNKPRNITRSLPTGREAREAPTYSGGYQGRTFSPALPTNNLLHQPWQQNLVTYSLDRTWNIAQPIQNVYDSTLKFQTRQPTTMQTLSELTSVALGPLGLQHNGSLGYPNLYQQQQDPQALIPKNYAHGIVMGAMLQPEPETMEEEDFQGQGPGVEVAYTAYQTALKQIFQNVKNGRLGEASQSLLEVSEWLLGHVGDLGLTVDEVTLHSDRIRLWGEFNTAWLSIFQKQKDMLESGQRIQHPETLMTQEFIKKMAKDLIRMCDAVEKHGLVDYQYGVAEEQIIIIVSECLDIQESIESHTESVSMDRAPP